MSVKVDKVTLLREVDDRKRNHSILVLSSVVPIYREKKGRAIAIRERIVWSDGSNSGKGITEKSLLVRNDWAARLLACLKLEWAGWKRFQAARKRNDRWLNREKREGERKRERKREIRKLGWYPPRRQWNETHTRTSSHETKGVKKRAEDKRRGDPERWRRKSGHDSMEPSSFSGSRCRE